MQIDVGLLLAFATIFIVVKTTASQPWLRKLLQSCDSYRGKKKNCIIFVPKQSLLAQIIFESIDEIVLFA